MSDVLPLLIVGLTTGSVYAIAAMGLVLTYKTSGVFNFAHGAQAAVAAYLMYTLRDQQGLPWPVAGLIALLVAGVVGGLLLERLAYALSSATTAEQVVATVGLLIGIQGLLVTVYGPATIAFEQFLPDTLLGLPGVNVRVNQLIVVGLALVAAVGLFVFFRRSRLGITMKAVVDEPVLVELEGVSATRVRRHAWVLGSVFAAGSGLLLAPTLGLDATLLTLLVVQAFGAAAIGAFSSLPGAYAGALGIGIATAVLPRYLGDASSLAGQSTLPFLVLFGVLVLRPKGLIEWGAHHARRRPAPTEMSRNTKLVAGAGIALVAVLVPLLVGAGIGVYTRTVVFVVLFGSLGLLIHASGQVSLAHMSFAAVGAGAFAHAAGAGVPWLLAVALGGLAAMPVGALVAVPAVRLSGVYLAVATFGFGILVERIFYNSFLLFGTFGGVEAPRPSLGFLPFDSDVGYYYVVLLVAAGCIGAIVLIGRSRLGRLLGGLADAPTALAAHGTNTNLTRLLVFCISAFLAGVAGALMGPITGTASAGTFGFFTSLLLVAVLAVAGRRAVLSPVIAAVLFSTVPWLVDSELFVDGLPVLFGTAALIAAIGPRWFAGRPVSGRTHERTVSTGPARERARVAAGASG